MVFVLVVTVPAPNVKALPLHVVLAPTVIAFALSIRVPTNILSALRVVAAVGVQNTSHDDAPLANAIIELAPVVNAPFGLKIYVPAPLKVTVVDKVIFIAPVLE